MNSEYAERLNSTGRSNFGTDEISSSPSTNGHSDLNGQIEDCFLANGGTGLFASKTGRAEVLTSSYRLATTLTNVDDQTLEEVLRHEYFLNRKRKPRNKPFLVAVELAAKPNDEPQYKLASEYAAILEHAHSEGVAPESLLKFFDSKAKYLHLIDARKARRETKRLAAESANKVAAQSADSLEFTMSPALRESLLNMNVGDSVQGKIRCFGPRENGWQQFKFVSTSLISMRRK